MRHGGGVELLIGLVMGGAKMREVGSANIVRKYLSFTRSLFRIWN